MARDRKAERLASRERYNNDPEFRARRLAQVAAYKLRWADEPLFREMHAASSALLHSRARSERAEAKLEQLHVTLVKLGLKYVRLREQWKKRLAYIKANSSSRAA